MGVSVAINRTPKSLPHLVIPQKQKTRKVPHINKNKRQGRCPTETKDKEGARNKRQGKLWLRLTATDVWSTNHYARSDGKHSVHS
jgi:hypothetical protein